MPDDECFFDQQAKKCLSRALKIDRAASEFKQPAKKQRLISTPAFLQ